MSDEYKKPREWWIETDWSKNSDSVYGVESAGYTHVIEYSAFEQAIKERDALKEMIKRINTHVFPGETDSIDSLRILFKERDEARAEVSRMKQYIAQAALGAHFRDPNHIAHAVQQSRDEDLNKLAMGLHSENAELRAEIERLKQERVTYRTMDSLLGDNGTICELHDDIEALEALLTQAEQALEIMISKSQHSDLRVPIEFVDKTLKPLLALIRKGRG